MLTRISIIWSTLFLALLIHPVGSSPIPAENGTRAFEPFNSRIGSAGVQADYKFTPYKTLVELAQFQVNMGSDAFKFTLPYINDKNSFLNTYPDLKPLPPEQCSSIVEMLKNQPAYETVFNLPLRFYVMYTYASGVPYYNCIEEGYSQTPHAREEYRQLYELTTYLMTKYQNTGKVFLLGQWEGDWPLRFGQGGRSMLNESKLRGTIEWYNNRYKAVDDARTALAHLEGVGVYHYEEVNVLETIINEPKVESSVNTILSEAKVDLVSYSAYNATNYTYELPGRLHRHLDHILKMTNFSGKWPYGKPVFIGEFNIVYEPNGRIRADKVYAAMRAASSWGCPLIMYWMSYAGIYRVDWDTAALIDPDGTVTEEYRDQQDFMGKLLVLKNASRVWLDRNPTEDEVNSLSAVLDRKSGTEIVSTIVNSSECAAKMQDEAFVALLFNNMFTTFSEQMPLYRQTLERLKSKRTTRWETMLHLLDSEEFSNKVPLTEYLKYMDRHIIRFPRPQKYEHSPSHHYCEALDGRAFLLQELALREVNTVSEKVYRKYMPYVRPEIKIDSAVHYDWPDTPMYAELRSFWTKPTDRLSAQSAQTQPDGFTTRVLTPPDHSITGGSAPRITYARPAVSPSAITPAVIIINYDWMHGRYKDSLELSRALRVPVLAVDLHNPMDDEAETTEFHANLKPDATTESLQQARPRAIANLLHQAWNYLQEEPDIDEANSVLYGIGWGSVYAALAAGTDTRIKNLVCVQGAGGWASTSAGRTRALQTLTSSTRELIAKYLDPVTYAPFSYARTTLFTGTQDAAFTWEGMQKLFIGFRDESGKRTFVAPNASSVAPSAWMQDTLSTPVLRMHLFNKESLPTMPLNAIWRQGDGRYTWASSGGSYPSEQASYLCWSPGRVAERSRYWKLWPGDRAHSHWATGLPEKDSANWGAQIDAPFRSLKAEAYAIVSDGPGRVVSGLPTLLPGTIDPLTEPGPLWKDQNLWDLEAGPSAWYAAGPGSDDRISSSSVGEITIVPGKDGLFSIITHSVILASGSAKDHKGIVVDVRSGGNVRELELTLRRDSGGFDYETFTAAVKLSADSQQLKIPWSQFKHNGNSQGNPWPFDGLVVSSREAGPEAITLGRMRFME